MPKRRRLSALVLPHRAANNPRMCGRYAGNFTWAQVHAFLSMHFPDLAPFVTPDEVGLPTFNAAPTQMLPVVVQEDRPALRAHSWGFHAPWMHDGSPRPINARAETAATTRMFRESWRERRCLVPVSGFYEWHRATTPSTAYFISVVGSPIALFAGLWAQEHDTSAGSFALLTTHANPLIATIHDRMPVVLRPADAARWLHEGLTTEEACEPFDADAMAMHEVSRRVGNVRMNDPSLMEQVTGEARQGAPSKVKRRDDRQPGLFE